MCFQCEEDLVVHVLRKMGLVAFIQLDFFLPLVSSTL